MADLNQKAFKIKQKLLEKHPEYSPISNVAELEKLNDDEMVAGYLSAKENTSTPGSDKSKSYWHGWRNGMVDFHNGAPDHYQCELAKQVVSKTKTGTQLDEIGSESTKH